MSVINIIKLMMASTLTCMVYACDFTEKNIDPNSPTSIEPGPLLTYTQLHTTTGGIAKNIQVGTCMMLVQQAASLNNDMPGDKYYQMESYANTFFTDTYSDLIKNWRELEEKASSDAKYSNILGATKIWGAYLFQRLTDIYGNVPYSEAGLGYYQQIYKPKYDNQETIYKDMIQQVKDGVNLLNANNPAIDGDLFYDGDINKWKKFGGSLLLRIGMRLSEVAPDLAKQTVADAVTIGVMSQPEDICLLRHDGSGKNAISQYVEFARRKKSQPFTHAFSAGDTRTAQKITMNSCSDRLQKYFIVDGFNKKVDRSPLETRNRHINIGMPRQKDGGQHQTSTKHFVL